MSFIQFISSKIFLRNLIAALILVFLLIFLSLFFLKLYTRHGSSFPVPDFRGMNLEEVEKVTRAENLRFVVTDSVYLQNQPRGTVVDQNPDPAFQVKKNRTIHLIMNAVTPEMVHIPKLVDLSFRQAKAQLEMTGLKVGKIQYVNGPFRETIMKIGKDGKDIKEGQEIIKGSKIDLFLASGYSSELTAIPALSGLELIKAEDKITNAYLNLGFVEYDETIKTAQDSVQAFVYKQSPAEGTRSTRGSIVDIELTIDKSKLAGIDSMQVQ